MAQLSEGQVLALAAALGVPPDPMPLLVPAQELDSIIAKVFPKIEESLALSVRQYLASYADEEGNCPWSEFVELVENTAARASADNAEDDPQVMSVMEQLSAEQIDMYRDTFIRLDRNGDGFVDRNELMLGVRDCVPTSRFAPLLEYLDRIFDVADKDRDNRLSLTEFLCSFADGPGVIPQDVVQQLVASIRVRLTDDEIYTLQESFKRIDKNQDGFVDRDELSVALREILLPRCPELKDQDFVDIVNMVLAAADRDKDDKLNLAEFIRSFQEDQGVLPAAFLRPPGEGEEVPKKPAKRKLTKEEVAILKQAFKTLDMNNDGFVSYAEMYTALSEALDDSDIAKDQIRTLVDLIMDTTERDRESGRLTLTEFIRNFVQHEDLMTIPVVAAHDRALDCTKKLHEMLDSGDIVRIAKVFEYLDTNKDGFLDKTELHVVLQTLLKERFPEWDQETLNEVENAIVDAADLNQDGKLSLEEFLHSFASGMDVLPLDIVNEWGEQLRRKLTPEELECVRSTFVAMDANHDGFVSRAELQQALSSALGEAIEDEAHLQRITDFVLEKVDENHDGKISLKEFVLSFERDQGVLPVVTGETALDRTRYEKCVKGIADLMSVANTIQIGQVFEFLDVNKDGFLDRGELHDVLQQLLKDRLPGWDSTALAELEGSIVEAADVNQDGLLSLREFLDAWKLYFTSPEARSAQAVDKLNSMLQRGDIVRISKVFNTLDRNKDGYLQEEELHELMQQLLKERFPEWSQDMVNEIESSIIQTADLDQDGKLSIHEFIQSFAEGMGVLPEELVLEWGAQLRRKLKPEEQEIVKKTFVAMDADKDGYVSRDELEVALSKALGGASSDQNRLAYILDTVFDLVDEDKDGKISLREFVISFEKDQGVLPVVIDPAKIERPDAPIAKEMERNPDTPIRQPPHALQPQELPTSPLPQLATSPVPSGYPPRAADLVEASSPFRNDVSGVCISTPQLLAEFRKFDKNHDGALDRAEFKKMYLSMEFFGLEPTQEEMDRLFSTYGSPDQKISFDEFCVLMLRRSRM